MADSEKHTPKKVSTAESSQLANARVQLKPAPRKVLHHTRLTTLPVKCICNEPKAAHLFYHFWCFVCNKFVQKVKRDDMPATQAPDAVDDSIEEVIDEGSINEHKGEAPSKKAKKDEKPHVQYPRQHVCVYKWGQIVVGQKYKAMSVGQESRSRTGLVLVPIDD